MVDSDFLKQKGVNPEFAPQIQEEILNSMRNNNFTELNDKYDSDVIEHLCNDLVNQGKLGRSQKVTSSGITFPYFLK